MNSLTIKNCEDVNNVINEIEQAFFDIPFQNSAFQTKMFVIADQITPARAYRIIGLQLFTKIKALKEYELSQEEIQIELDEIEFKLLQPDLDQFEKRRLDLKKRRIESSKTQAKKLLNDTLVDINFLYQEFLKFPKYTREEFENEELEHFKRKLDKQASIPNDSIQALLTIEKDFPYLQNLIEESEKKLKIK